MNTDALFNRWMEASWRTSAIATMERNRARLRRVKDKELARDLTPYGHLLIELAIAGIAAEIDALRAEPL